MKQNLLRLIVLLLCITAHVYAQNRTITGMVTDKADGSALPGVSIVVKGSKMGTQTSTDGKFSLALSGSQNVLVVTYLGYLTREVSVSGKSNVSIELTTDAKSLAEVVVTGYATEKRSQITGAVASVKGADIDELPVQTFDKALQGRAAGVQVTSNSGQPGGGVTINIRGVATINGSTSPLYIIDGVQVSPGGLSGVTTQNVMATINPADIESIEILKDAGSAAIYGSQAGNGVVLVTTKQGKSGATKMRASAQFGQNQEQNPYQLLNANEWYQLQVEGTRNAALRTGNSVNAAISALNTTYFGTTTAPADIPSYDWYDAIFRKADTKQYDLSFSGGDTRTKFFMSGSYNGTQGTIVGSNFTRGTLRANLSNKVSDKFTLETSLNISADKSTGPTTNVGFFTNAPFTGTLFTPPFNPIYNADGSYNTNTYPYGENLLQELNLEERQTGSFQTIDHLSLTYTPIKGLVARVFGGVEFADGRDYSYRPSSIPIYAPTNGTGSEISRRNIDWNTSGTLSYSRTVATDHNFTILGGVEYKETNGLVLSASAQNFPSPLLKLLSSAATFTAETSTFTGYKLLSFLGNLKYDYKGKYLLSANLREDGSSRFGANNRYGLFGGGSVGWKINEEEFMKSVDFVSDLKIRGSYGVTGVQPTGDFQSLNQYQSAGAAGGYNGSGAIRQTVLGNTDLKWEQSAQVDLGLDYGVFNNRISGSVDIYKKKNTNLILGITLPTSSGFASISQNIGSVEAKGLDFDFHTINVDWKGFRWKTDFNIALTKNKVLSLYNGLQFINTSHNYQVGQPLNTLYYFRYAGVNPADGRPMYYDKNDNITYNPVTGDQKNIGDTNPASFGGLGNTFSYKGVSLDVLFQYQYGNEALLQTAQVLEASGAYTDNQVRSQLERRWTTPGQITDTPRPYNGTAEPATYDPTNFYSRYIQTASYIRLKQVTLNYKLPTSLTKKLKIPSASFFLQGLNLATFTNYRDQDPETPGNSLNAFPNPKTYTGGITLDF